MPLFNPASPGGAPLPGPMPDAQMLITLLGNLMPLLLRLQPQGPDPHFGLGQFSQFGQPDPAGSPFGLAMPASPNPALDQQAAVNFIEDVTAESLRMLSAYLETHAERHAGLESCVSVVTQAAQSFAHRDYAQAFNLIWHAYRLIAMARAANPQLPPVRTGALPAQPAAVH